MFRESLLESSSQKQRGKRWPMATAFVLESIAACLVMVVPLLSTGVIPVAAHGPRVVAPLNIVRVASEPTPGTPLPGRHVAPATANVIAVAYRHNTIAYGPTRERGLDVPAVPSNSFSPSGPAPNVICDKCRASVAPGPELDRKIVVSRLSPAQIVYRVEPVYPRPAVMMGLQGEVKLHALIARDGTIQSLSVTRGHPLLVQAALDAVRQWRYHPYVLNGETVEVETFITVNFRRDR
jgi:periplasmic protein TonB